MQKSFALNKPCSTAFVRLSHLFSDVEMEADEARVPPLPPAHCWPNVGTQTEPSSMAWWAAAADPNEDPSATSTTTTQLTPNSNSSNSLDSGLGSGESMTEGKPSSCQSYSLFLDVLQVGVSVQFS